MFVKNEQKLSKIDWNDKKIGKLCGKTRVWLCSAQLVSPSIVTILIVSLSGSHQSSKRCIKKHVPVSTIWKYILGCIENINGIGIGRKKLKFQIVSWVLRHLQIWNMLPKVKIQVARKDPMWVFKTTAFEYRSKKKIRGPHTEKLSKNSSNCVLSSNLNFHFC